MSSIGQDCNGSLIEMIETFSVKSVLNKTSCELNPSDSVIPVVTHKLVNYYVRYKMYIYIPFEKGRKEMFYLTTHSTLR